MWQGKVRGWHLIAGLIAIASIGVGLAIYWTRSSLLDETALAAYLPKRDAALLYVDVKTIRASGILAKLVGSTVGEEAEYKSFIARSGFNYKEDLDRILMSSANSQHYFVLQGRFDWRKLKLYASQEGGRCDGDYCWVPGTTPGRIISFYPIRRDVMALASASNEKAGRDINASGPVKLPFDSPRQPIWLHVPASVLTTQQQLPAGMRLFLTAMQNAERLLITVGPKAQAIELAMDVTCKTAADAAIMKAQLESITALLKKLIAREKQQPSARDLSGVLTSGTFTREDRHVIGRWPVQKEFLDSIGGG